MSTKDTKRKLEHQAKTSKKKKISEETDDGKTSIKAGIFSGLSVFVLPAGLGKARADIFMKQLSKNGAGIEKKCTNSITHVIVDEVMTSVRMLNITKLDAEYFNKTDGSSPVVVKANWLSTCLSEGKIIQTDEYELAIEDPKSLKNDEKTQNIENLLPVKYIEKNTHVERNKSIATENTEGEENLVIGHSKKVTCDGGTSSPSVSPLKNKGVTGGAYDSDDSNYESSDEEEDPRKPTSTTDGETSSNTSTPVASPAKLPRGNWVCSKPSTSCGVNQNEHITEKLEILMKTYQNTQDKWRALGYKKAISALKAYSKPVTSWEEASEIPGIGSRLADKISEIIESGHLRKIDHVCKGEDMEALDIFTNIWGVGPTVAQSWIQQGLRTLEDVKSKVKLNKQQQIGMAHYDDFLERMPRDEAEQIGQEVIDAAHALNSQLVCTVCGSFRRGKKTCGDVDVLISHPDGISHKGILYNLMELLKNKGFLTDDLIKVEEFGEQKKYMGVCKLTGENRKYRRLDIIVSPYSQYPCALLHFTGSDHFNRSIRALAKKKGMSLSEHALRAGVIRRGKDKIHEGSPLPVSSEEDVFRHLGLEYRPPYERDY